MNEPEEMRVGSFAHSYLFRDGRFTSGAASVWPAESEVRQRVLFLSSVLNHRALSFREY